MKHSQEHELTLSLSAGFSSWAMAFGDRPIGLSPFGGHQWVVFTCVPWYSGDERIRAINQEFGRFDRFLPDTYGMRAATLAQLLESWRLRHADAADWEGR
jgi:hypothetical protein